MSDPNGGHGNSGGEDGSANNNKAFTQDMSPLDLLEQKSRRLAHKLHDGHGNTNSDSKTKPTTKSRPPTVGGEGLHRAGSSSSTLSFSSTTGPERHPSNASTTSSNGGNGRRIFVNEGDEWRPDSRASYVSRTGSVSSVASFGGILDSFRLSSLPVDSISEIEGGGYYYNDDDDDDDGYNDYNDAYDRKKNTNDDSDDSDTATIRGSDDPPDENRPPERVQSPTDSIGSDSSVYTANSHISTQQQQHVHPRPHIHSRPSYYSANSRNSVHPTTLNSNNTSSPSSSQQQQQQQQYYFPSNILSRPKSNYNNDNNNEIETERKTSGDLLRPPTLRQNTNNNSQQHLPKQPKDDDPSILTKRFKDMTLEDHVSAGIALHERGNLREASYHWQYSAFKGDHTAMLLYGLAIRHGWGMRKNPSEAVKWLRKAMESSINDTNGNSETPVFDLNSKSGALPSIIPTDDGDGKLKKAHIGLALYELGMSYLHSWGTEKDEDMALKAFEMAGSLGDSDALCEAAGLYMKSGPKGRKKDLQKAARLYREAADKGANMIGQSWIYKDKYMGEDKKKKKK